MSIFLIIVLIMLAPLILNFIGCMFVIFLGIIEAFFKMIPEFKGGKHE